MLEKDLEDRIQDYIDFTCPSIDSDYVFINQDGTQVSKLQNLIRYMSKEVEMKLPLLEKVEPQPLHQQAVREKLEW